MVGTDKDGLSAKAYFYINFVSKPYLNKALTNYQIRTEQYFTCTISKATFLHPNGDTITYAITSVPSWLTYTSSDMTFRGTPSSIDVGTFTIVVSGTDSKSETASTTFTIDVQKNYYPVVQKQIDDIQLDLNVPFNL